MYRALLVLVQEVAAYSSLAMTLSLVVARPRLGDGLRLSPALAAAAGVALMALFGVVGLGSATAALTELWRPFATIASIMVMTEVALRIGLIDWWAARIEAGAATTARLFRRVFVLSVAAATCLNNDAAILLLTPLVVRLVRRRFPDQPGLVLPFAFAVFMAAGVAPLPVSNPMNMVVADLAGIGFNAYAMRMIPVAVVGWIAGYAVLRLLFAPLLRGAPQTPASAAGPATAAQRTVMCVLAAVLLSYPVVGQLGGPVWMVAAAGAALALLLARASTGAGAAEVVRSGVSWETLAFLLAVLVLATGLMNVGFIGHLTGHYGDASTASIGITSALGSAALNNHPMAYLNLLALEEAGRGHIAILAALIGGDLGPRLLPMGSLAGLLWLEMLRRQGVNLRLRTFVGVGVAVTVPALLLSLLVLSLG